MEGAKRDYHHGHLQVGICQGLEEGVDVGHVGERCLPALIALRRSYQLVSLACPGPIGVNLISQQL